MDELIEQEELDEDELKDVDEDENDVLLDELLDELNEHDELEDDELLLLVLELEEDDNEHGSYILNCKSCSEVPAIFLAFVSLQTAILPFDKLSLA